MVRRTRGSGPSNGSRSPASSAHARCGPSGPDSASARAIPVSSRSPRIVASTWAPAASTASRPPGGSRRLRPVGWRERAQVTVEPRRVPAPARPVERVRPRADRLVRASLPVGEVVAALVPGPRPVRDLVATEAGRGEALHDDVVLRGRPVVVLLVDRLRPPATRARAAWAGDRRPARSAPPHPGRRGSARRPRRGPARARAPRPASPPRSPRPARGRRTAGRATPTRCPPREPRRPPPRRPEGGVDGPAAAAARHRTTARPATPASRPRRPAPARRRVRRARGSPRS